MLREAGGVEDERLGVLDGLRAVAVVLVLWYHVWEISWLPAPASWLQVFPETGFVGVHLFFFLSGFVITYPFVRARALGKPMPTWRHFAWRRFIKIVPSYLLSIAVAYALGYAAQETYHAPVWQEIVTHLLFIHTWFTPTSGAINGVLWTLAVEVEFYCIFPLLLFAFVRRPWLTGATMIAGAFAWRIARAACCAHVDTTFTDENLPNFLDIFACGMLAAWCFVRFQQPLRERAAVRTIAPLIALAGCALFFFLLNDWYATRHESDWMTAWAVYKQPLLGIAFATIALASLFSPSWWQAVFANRPLRFLAIISYNLYLYHQIIARELVRWHIPPYIGDPHASLVWQQRFTIVAVVATIAQAALITYFFERPFLRTRPRPIGRALGYSPLR